MVWSVLLLLLISLVLAPAAQAGSTAEAQMDFEQAMESMGRLAGAAHACEDDIYLRISDCAGAMVERLPSHSLYQRLFMESLLSGFYDQPVHGKECSRLSTAIPQQPFWLLCPGLQP